MAQSDNGAAKEAILTFDDVSLRFGDITALNDVSFTLNAGETRIVFGAAGSGKTTLLKTAIGLVRPDSGRVYLFGQDITRMREQDLFELRSRVGILFQESALFDSITVGENVAYPLLNQKGRTNSSEEVQTKVRDALRFVELEQTIDKFPSELSGGMRRRVGIARAVVTEPPLVLYDSPTAGLDPITANTIMALLAKERDMANTANLIVSHRYQDGQIMTDFRYNPQSGRLESFKDASPGQKPHRTIFMVMNAGRLVFEGDERELEASQDKYVSKFVLRHP